MDAAVRSGHRRSEKRATSPVSSSINNQLALLAYEYDPATRLLLLLGSHENFYRELKRSWIARFRIDGHGFRIMPGANSACPLRIRVA